MYYNIFYDRITVNLDPTFRFCHNKSNYMIFKNWLLLTQNDWDLHTMTNESPSKYISIEFKETLKEGDVIEIFYLPMSYDEIDITSDIDITNYNTNGDIMINQDHLGYSFDKDLFMITVGGWKINHNNIQNINNHRCRITTDNIEETSEMPYPIGKSVPSIYLYRLLQPDKLLSKIYSYSDKWSDAVDGLSVSDYVNLLTKFTKS